MRPSRGAGWLVALVVAGSACSPGRSPVVVGAVYPTRGGQGEGGVEEYRGVRLAAELAGRDGSHPVELVLDPPADSADAAPGAVDRLAERGIGVVLGSYGSTISRPAAVRAAEHGLVFWETGAVGEMSSQAQPGERFFRVPATGGDLGGAAVAFVADRLAPVLGEQPGRLRYGVAYVDDVYGRSVGNGALARIRRAGLPLAGVFPYAARGTDFADLAQRVERTGTDVLMVAAYLEDGLALRRAIVEADVPLVATVGTSSSYCMPDFGRALGAQAVGLFASDKPETPFLDPGMLSPRAGTALRWARTEYQERYDEEMSASALSGFASAWALFEHVLPAAGSDRPDDVADAARSVRLPRGALPNGSGLAFAPPEDPRAGANLRAASVIWEWIRPNTRAVVWPPSLADSAIVPLRP